MDWPRAHIGDGRYADAEPLFKRALNIEEKALGSKAYVLAIQLASLGLIYKSERRYVEAEEFLKRSLTVAEDSLGPAHPAVADVLGNLAQLFLVQGRYADALPFVQRMIANGTANAASVFPVLFGAMSDNLLSRDVAINDSLTVAQNAWHSSAGDAINALAARVAAGTGRLEELVRQDRISQRHPSGCKRPLLRPFQLILRGGTQLRNREREIALLALSWNKKKSMPFSVRSSQNSQLCQNRIR